MKKEIKICEISTGTKGSGYLSRELLNKMIVEFKRAGHVLTDIYITQKGVDDINGWTDVDLSVEEREEMFNNTGNSWNVNIHKVDIDSSGKSLILGFDFENSEMSEVQKLTCGEVYFSGGNLDAEVFGVGVINRLNE